MVRIPSLPSYASTPGSLTSSRPVYKRDSSGVFSRLSCVAVRPLPSVIAIQEEVAVVVVEEALSDTRHFLVAKNGCLTPVRSLFAASIAVSSLFAC